MTLTTPSPTTFPALHHQLLPLFCPLTIANCGTISSPTVHHETSLQSRCDNIHHQLAPQSYIPAQQQVFSSQFSLTNSLQGTHTCTYQSNHPEHSLMLPPCTPPRPLQKPPLQSSPFTPKKSIEEIFSNERDAGRATNQLAELYFFGRRVMARSTRSTLDRERMRRLKEITHQIWSEKIQCRSRSPVESVSHCTWATL